eukprot:GEMP01035641.1.p1 GENE.GEMP01035641.1~~GEMP01035641.1.p1  ORF type:complete len:411 (+),score=54.88 GEMP01035641.1:80-1234(+)
MVAAVPRIAVVGTGRMGEIRIKDILDNPETVKLAGIVTSRPENAAKLITKLDRPEASQKNRLISLDSLPSKKFAKSASDDMIFSTLESLLLEKGDSLDALWICAPSDLHKDFIFQCARAKKHVAVEKPVCISKEDILACYEECAKNGVVLHCSFQRRFDPIYQKLADTVRSGFCGDRLCSIRTVFRDHPCPPIEFLKKGGDPFHDLAVHDIDFIRSLVPSEEPTEVWASGASTCDELKNNGILDSAVISMRYPSGLTVSIEISRHSDYGYDQRCEVFGVNGRMVTVDNPTKTVTVKKPNEAGSMTEQKLCHSFQDRFHDAFQIELNHFAKCVNAELHANPLVSAKDAHMATLIAEAARQSALEGRIMVFDQCSGGTTFSAQSKL